MQGFYILLLVGLGLLAAMFAVENPQLVDFGFFYARVDVALSLLLSAMLTVGVIIGLAAGAYIRWRLRRRCRRLETELGAMGPGQAVTAAKSGTAPP